MTNEEAIERLKEASFITQEKLDKMVQVSNEAAEKKMIPKIVHFCYCGWRNIEQRHLDCMKTWFEVLKDYIFVNWTIDTTKDTCEHQRWCRENNKYAFYADYIRVAKVYEWGGVYMDSDVEVFKPFDPLLDIEYVFDTEIKSWYMDCGVFLARRGQRFLKAVKDRYELYKYGDFMKDPAIFLAGRFWKETLIGAGAKLIFYLKKENLSIEEYRELVNKEELLNVYILDGTWISCPERKLLERGESFPRMEHTFSEHRLFGTWSFI